MSTSKTEANYGGETHHGEYMESLLILGTISTEEESIWIIESSVKKTDYDCWWKKFLLKSKIKGYKELLVREGFRVTNARIVWRCSWE